MFNQVARKTVAVASSVAMLAGCAKGGGSFSTLADSASFKQEASYTAKKIDILWIIDNSGSMESSQTNLANNFQAFIARFNQSSSDFHMAVGTTEAWMKQFNLGNPSSGTTAADMAKIRDGAKLSSSVTTHSGVFVMDKNTPNLSSVFQTNIKQGTNGNGDERAFESFKQILNEPWNAGFRRPDAFLAIIIVSDEDDFSNSTTSLIEDYNSSKLYSVQSYVNFLDTYTGGTANGRNYAVSNISIQDTACLNQLAINAQKVNQRYKQLTSLTGGVQGSLCSNFGSTLDLISENIIQLSSVFKLNREPIPESIVVTVDGVSVPQNATNGWTYDSSNLTITFHGSSVPGANSAIKINFDPKTIQL